MKTDASGTCTKSGSWLLGTCNTEGQHPVSHRFRNSMMYSVCSPESKEHISPQTKSDGGVGHTSPERPFGCEQRERVSQVEPHLSAEFADSPSPSAVILDCACLDDVLHHVQVLRCQRERAVINLPTRASTRMQLFVALGHEVRHSFELIVPGSGD